MDNKKKMAGWVVLVLIVVVAAVALAVTNMVTEEPIAQRGQAQADAAVRQLFPDAEFEQTADGMMAAKRNGQIVGYAVTTQAQGYAGPIEVMTGIEVTGTLSGISVGGTDFKETEGLGARAKEPAFTDQFKGKQPPLTVGQQIDAIAGATVTSRAVTQAVNEAAQRVSAMTGSPAAPSEQPAATDADRTVNVSTMGYGGPVLVRMTMDDEGAIAAIDIGGARFNETAGLGALAKEPAFANQFIGKKPPLAMTDIDAIAGATVTTQAVLDAVNEGAQYLAGE